MIEKKRNAFSLLLPALFPSWRFFDRIAPSPRIEFRLLKTHDTSGHDTTYRWQPYNPRPRRIGIGMMGLHLLWNPHWNDDLFLVSCAERFIQNSDQHSYNALLNRIRNQVQSTADISHNDLPNLQFRLVFCYREGGAINHQPCFTSPVESLDPCQ